MFCLDAEDKAREVVLSSLKAVYIDNGFYRIHARRALTLCEMHLPKFGYEKKVQFQGFAWWIARTMANGTQVWSIRAA